MGVRVTWVIVLFTVLVFTGCRKGSDTALSKDGPIEDAFVVEDESDTSWNSRELDNEEDESPFEQDKEEFDFNETVGDEVNS